MVIYTLLHLIKLACTETALKLQFNSKKLETYTKVNLLRTSDTDENKIQKYKKYHNLGGEYTLKFETSWGVRQCSLKKHYTINVHMKHNTVLIM